MTDDGSLRIPSTGVSTLDRDHDLEGHLLGALRDRLAEADDALVAEVIEQIVEYTRVHCESEELLIKLYNYPLAPTHLQEHKVMLTKTEDLRAAVYDANPAVLTQKINDFVAWMSGHIKRDDRALGIFLREAGVGSSRSTPPKGESVRVAPHRSQGWRPWHVIRLPSSWRS